MRRRLATLAVGGSALVGLLAAPASAQPDTCRAEVAIELRNLDVPPVELVLVVPEVAAEASPALRC
jgi:hypothetical protein